MGNQDFYISLTFAVYRVLELFPAEEKSTAKIMQSANRTLSDLIIISEKNPVTNQQKNQIVPRVLREIEYLHVYLRDAQNENWINPDNFLVLRKEYRRVERFLEDLDLELQDEVLPKEIKEEKKEPVLETKKNTFKGKESLSERQKKIIDILKEKEQIQVREIQKILPNVTKRTLRRDLDDLMNLNLIERKGQWSSVFYRIKV